MTTLSQTFMYDGSTTPQIFTPIPGIKTYTFVVTGGGGGGGAPGTGGGGAVVTATYDNITLPLSILIGGGGTGALGGTSGYGGGGGGLTQVFGTEVNIIAGGGGGGGGGKANYNGGNGGSNAQGDGADGDGGGSASGQGGEKNEGGQGNGNGGNGAPYNNTTTGEPGRKGGAGNGGGGGGSALATELAVCAGGNGGGGTTAAGGFNGGGGGSMNGAGGGGGYGGGQGGGDGSNSDGLGGGAGSSVVLKTPKAAGSDGYYTTATTGYGAGGLSKITGGNGLVIVSWTALPPTIAYSGSPYKIPAGSAFTSDTPVIDLYNIRLIAITCPNLPAGLTLDATTGIITGTLSALQVYTTCTVTITTPAGSGNTVIVFEGRSTIPAGTLVSLLATWYTNNTNFANGVTGSSENTTSSVYLIYGAISEWDTSLITDMSNLFNNANYKNLNIDIAGWNTAAVTSMNSMFKGVVAFNQNIASWNTAVVTSMNSMFNGAAAFNNGGKPLTWTASPLLNDTSYMFAGATAFNQNISQLNTGNVYTMNSMFSGATAFNNGSVANDGLNPLTWTTSALLDASYMFYNGAAFNQSLPNFSTKIIQHMEYMFNGALTFDQDVSAWVFTNTNIVRISIVNMFLGVKALSTINNDSIYKAWLSAGFTVTQLSSTGLKPPQQQLGSVNMQPAEISYSLVDGKIILRDNTGAVITMPAKWSIDLELNFSL